MVECNPKELVAFVGDDDESTREVMHIIYSVLDSLVSVALKHGIQHAILSRMLTDVFYSHAWDSLVDMGHKPNQALIRGLSGLSMPEVRKVHAERHRNVDEADRRRRLVQSLDLPISFTVRRAWEELQWPDRIALRGESSCFSKLRIHCSRSCPQIAKMSLPLFYTELRRAGVIAMEGRKVALIPRGFQRKFEQDDQRDLVFAAETLADHVMAAVAKVKKGYSSRRVIDEGLNVGRLTDEEWHKLYEYVSSWWGRLSKRVSVRGSLAPDESGAKPRARLGVYLVADESGGSKAR
jgi:hypothetical protein